MNSITLVGNLTRDPELRYTPNGRAVASFAVAVSQSKDAEGNWQSDFFECVAWGTLADNIGVSLHKGTRVILCGKLYTEKWVDKNNTKRTTTKIRVAHMGAELSFATCGVFKANIPTPEDGGKLKFKQIFNEALEEADMEDVPF